MTARSSGLEPTEHLIFSRTREIWRRSMVLNKNYIELLTSVYIRKFTEFYCKIGYGFIRKTKSYSRVEIKRFWI